MYFSKRLNPPPSGQLTTRTALNVRTMTSPKAAGKRKAEDTSSDTNLVSDDVASALKAKALKIIHPIPDHVVPDIMSANLAAALEAALDKVEALAEEALAKADAADVAAIRAADLKKVLKGHVKSLDETVRDDWHNSYQEISSEVKDWFVECGNAVEACLKDSLTSSAVSWHESCQSPSTVGVAHVGSECNRIRPTVGDSLEHRLALQCNEVLKIVAYSWVNVKGIPFRCDVYDDVREVGYSIELDLGGEEIATYSLRTLPACARSRGRSCSPAVPRRPPCPMPPRCDGSKTRSITACTRRTTRARRRLSSRERERRRRVCGSPRRRPYAPRSSL